MVFPLLLPLFGFCLAGIAGGVGLSSAGAHVRHGLHDAAGSVRGLSGAVNNGVSAVTAESLRWHGTVVHESAHWRGAAERGTDAFKHESTQWRRMAGQESEQWREAAKHESEQWREAFNRTHADWLRQSEAWQAESSAWRFFAVDALSDVALGIEYCMKMAVLFQVVWAALIIFCFWALGEVIWQAARPGGRGEGAPNPFTRVLLQLAALAVGLALGAVLLRAYVYVYATYSRGDLVFAALPPVVCCAVVANVRGGCFTVSTVHRVALVCAATLLLWREGPIGEILAVYDSSGVPPSGCVRMDGSSGGPIVERGMTLTSSGGAAPYLNPTPRVTTRLINAKVQHMDTLVRDACGWGKYQGSAELPEKNEFGDTLGQQAGDFTNPCSYYATRQASFAPGTETVEPGHREPINDPPRGLATPMYMYVGNPMRALFGTALAFVAACLVPLAGGEVTGVVEGKVVPAAEGDDVAAAAAPGARRDAGDWQFWIQPLALLVPVALVAGFALQSAFR